jgi:hypothetical protein
MCIVHSRLPAWTRRFEEARRLLFRDQDTRAMSAKKLIQICQIVIVGDGVALIGDGDRLVDVLEHKIGFFENQFQEQLYLRLEKTKDRLRVAL